jgi:hypothetical protein
MIYSNNIGIATDRILIEVARFQPSASVPTSLKKTVIGVCNNILNKSKKLDREDKKVDRALKAIEGGITLAKDNSYTDNAYPIEIHSAITNGEACMDYAVSVVRAIGFKHSNMKEGKKGQTWYKVSGNDILIATIVGTLLGNSMVTIIMHAVENSDHNNDILNGILESTVLTEGQQAEEYKARKTKEAEKNNPLNNEHDKRFTAKYGSFPSDKYDNSPGTKKVEKEISKRMFKAMDDGNMKNYINAVKHSTHAADATERHMRRHPEQYKEGTIFESVEFI